MKKLMTVMLVLVAMVVTWFVSYDYTIKSLHPSYIVKADTFMIMDYLGNINEYGGEVYE